MIDDVRKYILYARKSSDQEDQQTLSLDSQINTMEGFARMHDLQIAETITEAESAKRPGRPGFAKLLTLLRRGQANAILTWKLDRLTRHPFEGGELILLVEDGKLLEIVTPDRSFRNSGSDKFLMQLEFGLAKRYVDDLSDNVKRGNRAKLERGWLPGLPPTGYMNDRLTRTIVPDPDRFHLVRRMWDMVLEGERVPEIVRIANETWGFHSRKYMRAGGRPLSLSTLYGILKKPFYYGLIERNGESFPGSHVPMVTKAEFDRVQDLIRRRVHAHRKRHFAYTGLIRCGECGCAITAEHHVNRQGHEYTYYHCTKRRKGVKCSQRSIREEKLKSQLLGFIQEISVPISLQHWALRYLSPLAKQHPDGGHASPVVLEDPNREGVTAVSKSHTCQNPTRLQPSARFHLGTALRKRMDAPQLPLQREILVAVLTRPILLENQLQFGASPWGPPTV